MSEVTELLKNIEKQNEEIIRLLKIIAGENSQTNSLIDNYVVIERDDDRELREIPDDEQLFNDSLDIGEIFFVDGDEAFKLAVKNNETSVDNLNGNAQTTNFNVQEIIANESISRNKSLDDGTVILGVENSKNLSKTLKICIEQGAKSVYIPWSELTQVMMIYHTLKRYIDLDYYKNEDDLIEKIFEKEEREEEE